MHKTRGQTEEKNKTIDGNIAQFDQLKEHMNDIKTENVKQIKELEKVILEKENVISEMRGITEKNKSETESAKSELERLKNENSTNLRLKEQDIEKLGIELQKGTQIVGTIYFI